MILSFATRDLERKCTGARRMQTAFGQAVAKTLKLRIAELVYAKEMNDLLLGSGRWEQLMGDRTGYWSARLTGNWRLIVKPEAGVEVRVLVVEVVDYH